ncbi:MAG: hypothetical protein K6F53_04800 [Lachnospiraceae bacterium]|nr:hypothetical protein [Lachnospiraceae bacterium]
MKDLEMLELYLRRIVEFCEAYDAFSIPAAMMSGGTEVRLQDVYTHLSYYQREEYEKGISSDADSSVGNGLTDMDLESLIAKIDAKIAELEIGIEEPGGWNWFLSEPGGGKTTLLKMFSLAYAYRYYTEHFGKNAELFGGERSIEDIETICGRLGVDKGNGACPVFISVRDLKEEDYPGISDPDQFKKLVLNSMNSLVGETSSGFDAESLFPSIGRIVYFIDSLEEFSNAGFRKEFLKGLDAFAHECRCCLSARYREYMESIRQEKPGRAVMEYTEKEYVIGKPTEETVRAFAGKWYEALNRISDKKLDVDRDFLIPIHKNPNVKELIANPLELTSLLMISSYDSCLPSDFVKIYGRSIELWLNWNNHDRYNYEDILRQLSQVAYRMAASENEKIIVSHETLSTFIKQARSGMKRYYQQEWSEDQASVDRFIQFLCDSRLISRSTEGYDFIHRQYQAYLAACCITTNNFPRETRRKRRLDYVMEHILEKDDFWNQIIIIIVMLDIELRDDIISALFELSEEENAEPADRNYYISLLIQLAAMPGVNFDDLELEELFGLIVRDPAGWGLFDSKRADLQRLFELNDEKGNDLFIEEGLKKNGELPEAEKGRFRDSIGTVLFHCIWNCRVGEQYISDVLRTFYVSSINTNIMEMLYHTGKLTTGQQIIREKACLIGEEALRTSGYSDCYMLIAAITGYADYEDPYSAVTDLIEKKEFGSDVTAINILMLAAWLTRCKEASRYGYKADPGIWTNYAEFVLRGITDKEHREMQRVYLMAFSDIFAIGESSDADIWFREEVFEYILSATLAAYEEDQSPLDESGSGFSYFEHLSMYPCRYSQVCVKVLKETGKDPSGIREKLWETYRDAPDLMIRVRAAKLLILFADMQPAETKPIAKELETQGKDIPARNRLVIEDMITVFTRSLEQIKDYSEAPPSAD